MYKTTLFQIAGMLLTALATAQAQALCSNATLKGSASVQQRTRTRL